MTGLMRAWMNETKTSPLDLLHQNVFPMMNRGAIILAQCRQAGIHAVQELCCNRSPWKTRPRLASNHPLGHKQILRVLPCRIRHQLAEEHAHRGRSTAGWWQLRQKTLSCGLWQLSKKQSDLNKLVI